MKKVLIFLMLAIISAGAVLGQESKKKMAVYVDDSNRNITEFIEDYITNAIVKKGSFVVIERTARFLEKLGKEHGFERSGAVDDKQISAIGKIMGVHYVCAIKISAVTRTEYTITSRLIDVETAEVTTSSHPILIDVKNLDAIGKSCKHMINSLFSKQSSDIISGNSYLGWGVLDVGYPLNLSTSIIGRFGGTMGIGFQFGVGCDFGGKSTYSLDSDGNYSETGDPVSINYLSYNVGLRLYPYKNIYILTSYGTLGCEKISGFNDSEGRFGTEGWRHGKGFSVIAGYDLIPGDKFGHSGFLLSIGAGMAYDSFLTKWSPMINLKIGGTWDILTR